MKGKYFIKCFSVTFLAGFFLPAVALADASLFLSPNTGTYVVGAEIDLRILVSSGGTAVNGIEADLTYNPNELTITGISVDGSVINSWTRKPYIDEEMGMISFGGAISGTSTTLNRGLALTLHVEPRRIGKTQVFFENGTINAADGTGSNILTSFGRGTYIVNPTDDDPEPQAGDGVGASPAPRTGDNGEVLGEATGTPSLVIASPSHPDHDRWYGASAVSLAWIIPPGTTNMRFGVSKSPNVDPSIMRAHALTDHIVTTVEEGISYAQLIMDGGGHTSSSSYLVRVDRTPPTGFSVDQAPREQPTDPNIMLTLSATDTLSGVAHYEFTVDEEKPIVWIDNGTHQFRHRVLHPGAHAIEVFAVDGAGNRVSRQLSFDVAYLAAPLIAFVGDAPIEGEHIGLSFTATPKTTLNVFMSRNGEEPAVEEQTVPDSGKGVFRSELSLEPGTYTVWAMLRGENGESSEESARLTVEITASFFGLFARHPLMPVMAFVLLALLVLSGYLFRRAHTAVLVRSEALGQELFAKGSESYSAIEIAEYDNASDAVVLEQKKIPTEHAFLPVRL